MSEQSNIGITNEVKFVLKVIKNMEGKKSGNVAGIGRGENTRS